MLCTGFEMRLSRHVLKYLYIYYLPSGLFVVVSWVGFLIPPEVIDYLWLYAWIRVYVSL